MILRQFLNYSPIAASYVIGCAGQQICAVVDPLEDVEPYLAAARDGGMRIGLVIDTHLHADHRSGGRALAERTGADYVLHQSAQTGYAFRGVSDGEVLELGNVILKVLHTPGHTPEHICLLGVDRTRGEDPWFVLSGHTLMVGDMGRTELASDAEHGARDLYSSARRLAALPEHVEVMPGAFAGSVCGRALSGKPVSTIGFERRFNRAFQEADEAVFVARMLADIPPRPPEAEATRAWNQGLLASKGSP